MTLPLTFDRVEWLSFAVLAVPVRAQLSALVFVKSMHMRDIKGAQEPRNNRSQEANPDFAGVLDLNDAKMGETDDTIHDENRATEVKPKEEVSDSATDEAAVVQVRQGAINLVGVDAQRISQFCGFNQEIPGTILKIVIAVGFLVQLIGWWAVLAGLAVSIAFQPLNSIAATHYYAQQSAVMAARDTKTHVVTEALQGIRQIKFSAVEDRWQKSILAARNIELDKQWRVYIWAIYLTFCWVSTS